MKKQLLTILIAFLAVLQNVSAYDFSAVAPSGQTLFYNYADGINGNSVYVTYPGSNQNIPYYGYTKPTGVLTIPDSASNGSRTYCVTGIGEYAFFNCTGLSSFTIPNSIINIGENAFHSCTGLMSATIPDSVLSIGGHAFYYCVSLNSITIGNSVASIGSEAFYGCTSLTSVTIPNSVISIGSYAFSECTSLISVAIPNSVISMGVRVFQGCISLLSVTIPNSITSISNYTFNGCTGLTSITIPNSVTSIGECAFHGCTSLLSVVIPDSVTNIGEGAFYECTGLTSVIIGNSVTCIDVATFGGCSNLTLVTIPNSVISIGERAFVECTALTSVTIGNSVTNIGYNAFYGCNNIYEITSHATTAPLLGTNAFYGVPSYIGVNIPCGSQASYNSRWSSYFNNFIEPRALMIDVTSADETMGQTNIITQPTCQSPVAEVQATAIYGYHFTHWNDGDTNNPRIVTLTQDTSFTAFFDRNRYSITALSSDTSKGSAYGSDSAYYLDTMTLIAVANYGYIFYRWEGTLLQGDYLRTGVFYGDTLNIAIIGEIVLNAIFLPDTFNIMLSVDTSIHGTVDGTGMYSYLSDCIISASANYGYHFTHWDDGNTDNPRTITLTQDTQFVAMFAKNTYTLVFQSNNSSIGMVDTTSISGEYLDTSILIHATATPHYHFVRWSDYNTENPRRFVFYDNCTYTANFVIDTHTVSVQTNDIVRGMVEATGTEFVYGSPCTVTATAYSGYTFVRWSNGVTYNPYTFAVIQDLDLTAIFEEVQEIDDVNICNIAIQAYDGHITVLGADGIDVRVYDMMGHQVAYSTTAEEHNIPMPTAGVYLVKVGTLPARKVVVIR